MQDVKARFSEVLDICEGPQVVTRRGIEAVVLVPVEAWRRITHRSRRTLKELLLADDARGDLDLPPRGNAGRRARPTF